MAAGFLVEFIVRDPASSFIEAEAQLQGISLDQIVPPEVKNPSGITRDNYLDLAARYGVVEVAPPPPKYKTVGVALPGSGAIQMAQLALPEGYCAETVVLSYALQQSELGMTLEGLVGSVSFQFQPSTLTGVQVFPVSPLTLSGGNVMNLVSDPPAETTGTFANLSESASIPIAVIAWQPAKESLTKTSPTNAAVDSTPFAPPTPTSMPAPLTGFAVNVEVRCQVFQPYEAWQLQTYEAIMRAYEKKKNEYYAQAGSQRSLAKTQNPLFTREAERNTLKRACADVLLQRRAESAAVATQTAGVPNEEIDAPRCFQFLDQAFEWNEMVYTFYPHTKGGPGASVSGLFSLPGDELFTAFLRADWARVLVPVHLEYDLPVLYYLSNGTVWNGKNDLAPVNERDIPIAHDLKNAADRPRQISCGESWEITVPTPMVVLQEDATLPSFADEAARRGR